MTSAAGSSTVGRIAFALGAACVCVGLLVWALPRISQGAEIERTDVAWNSLVQGPRLSRTGYARAEQSLTDVAPADGATLVRKAAFTALGSGDMKKAATVAREAVEASPADPQAWTLFCEILAQRDVGRAARCLDTALVVAPFDWFVAGRRAALAATLWPALTDDTREAAARETRRLWTTDGLRDQLWGVMQRPHAADLVLFALRGDRESLRAFNRWYIRKELCGGACSPKVD